MQLQNDSVIYDLFITKKLKEFSVSFTKEIQHLPLKKLAPFSVLLKNSHPEKGKIKTMPYFFGSLIIKQNFGRNNSKHVEVFISLYFIICMVVLLMCLQRQDSRREILKLVMQAQVGFKNILLNFSEKKKFQTMNLVQLVKILYQEYFNQRFR